MQATRIALPLALAAIVGGCATNLTPGGMQVKYVTTPAEVAGCKPLGTVHPETQVSHSGTLPGDIQSEEQSSARIEARNQASSLGATHVLIDEAKHPSLDEGTAFRCGAKATGGL